jgi:hypothetical protein
MAPPTAGPSPPVPEWRARDGVVGAPELLDEVQALIREREQQGIRGLATSSARPTGPRSSRVSTRMRSRPPPGLPDEELPELLEELSPEEAAALLRTLTRPRRRSCWSGWIRTMRLDVVEELPDAEVRGDPRADAPRGGAGARELAAYPPDSRAAR